jgi:hypothetical protein
VLLAQFGSDNANTAGDVLGIHGSMALLKAGLGLVLDRPFHSTNQAGNKGFCGRIWRQALRFLCFGQSGRKGG